MALYTSKKGNLMIIYLRHLNSEDWHSFEIDGELRQATEQALSFNSDPVTMEYIFIMQKPVHPLLEKIRLVNFQISNYEKAIIVENGRSLYFPRLEHVNSTSPKSIQLRSRNISDGRLVLKKINIKKIKDMI